MRKIAALCAFVLVLGASGEAMAGKKVFKTTFEAWGHNSGSEGILGVFGWIDAKPACEKDRKIVLFKKRAGNRKDKRMGSAKTGAILVNRFEINRKLKPGRYYLRAPKKKLKPKRFCGAAKSGVQRLTVR